MLQSVLQDIIGFGNDEKQDPLSACNIQKAHDNRVVESASYACPLSSLPTQYSDALQEQLSKYANCSVTGYSTITVYSSVIICNGNVKLRPLFCSPSLQMQVYHTGAFLEENHSACFVSVVLILSFLEHYYALCNVATLVDHKAEIAEHFQEEHVTSYQFPFSPHIKFPRNRLLLVPISVIKYKVNLMPDFCMLQDQKNRRLFYKLKTKLKAVKQCLTGDIFSVVVCLLEQV